MEVAPLFSFELYDLPGGITRLYLYNHHILWDGWSLSILMNEFIQGYDTALETGVIVEGYVSDYGAYVKDLYDRDHSNEGIDYWQEYLLGLEGGVYLPFLKDTSLRNSVFGDSHVSFELGTANLRVSECFQISSSRYKATPKYKKTKKRLPRGLPKSTPRCPR